MFKKYGDPNPVVIINPGLDDEETKKSLKKAIKTVKQNNLPKKIEKSEN